MKNLKLYLILAVLIIIAGIFYFSNNKGTLNLRVADFSVDQYQDITKIEIISPQEKLKLELTNNQWKVNDKYWATEKYVKNLLLALNRLTILSPVSKAEKEQVASILKADGMLVKVYKNRRTVKEFYVSKPSMNQEKTYMMMKKSSEPFIVSIPAFRGLLADLFITDENYWRNKTIFDYEPQNIKSIRVEYPEEQIKSFQVNNYNDGTFAVQNLVETKFIEDFDVEKVARYFTYYQRIVFEDVVRDLSQGKIDSVLKATPYCIITVKDDSDEENKITIYRKPSEKKYDEFGQELKFDYDRAYASFNQNKELIIIQYYIFDPLFKEIDYFR
ncbi:MAG: DUF4340 domain-containing protein [Bacteroidetes bacterium]|nr:DUF4340 domain-containing protein [Bacteroidota bacterium]